MNELTKRIVAMDVWESELPKLRRSCRKCRIPFNVETILGYLTASANRHAQLLDVGSTILGLVRGHKSIDFSSNARHRTLAKYVKYEIKNQCYLQKERKRGRTPRKEADSPLHALNVRYDYFLRRLIENPLFGLSPKFPLGVPIYPNVEFFTTNYDDVLETFFDWAGVPITDGYVEDIGSPKKGEHVTFRFDEVEFDDAQALRIYRLYGSIGYARYKNSITRIDPYTWSNPSRRRDFGDLLIYPGATKVIWSEPQLQLFYRLRRRLCDPTTLYCIVIGYSFRDRPITSIFKDALALNTSLRIFVVGKQARTIARSVFGDHHSIKPVGKNFETLDPVRDLR